MIPALSTGGKSGGPRVDPESGPRVISAYHVHPAGSQAACCALQATADFYTGEVVAELSTMHHQFLNPFIRRKLGDLLLIEQIAGKPLKKYLLLWMPLGELPTVDITAMGAAIGIDVLIYSQPHDAAQFLLQLH